MVKKYVSLSPKGIIIFGLLCFLIMEAVTLFFRFGLEMTSQEDTAFLAPFTFGWRIHHGYVGLVMLIWAFGVHIKLNRRHPFTERCLNLPKFQFCFNTITTIGLGLFCSDIVHHFLVLWPLTGSPNFDLTYL